MKVERSKNHTRFMHDLAARYNARVIELVNSGMAKEQAVKQANEEIIIPAKDARTKRLIEAAKRRKET
jgi:hypothetical protein